LVVLPAIHKRFVKGLAHLPFAGCGNAAIAVLEVETFVVSFKTAGVNKFEALFFLISDQVLIYYFFDFDR